MTILSNTQYDWRLDLIRNHGKIGEAKIKSCSIDFVEDADVMHTMKVQVPFNGFEVGNVLTKQDEDVIYFNGTRFFNGTWCFASVNGIWVSTETKFDMFYDRLRPIMIIDGTEYAFGDYIIISAPLEDDGKEYYYDIEAYDETMILKQSSLTERKYFPAGTQYMSIIGALIIDCGISRIMGDNTNAAITVDHEYAIGTNYLTIINDLLDEINYSHVYAGLDGSVFLSAKKTKFVADYEYTEKNSTIIDPIKTETDIYSLPNVIIGFTSSPDTNTVLQYKKVNNNPDSVISTTRRGYNVVEAFQLDDCPDLATLTEAVNYKYMEATQATEKATVNTMPDGYHNLGTYISLGQRGNVSLFREVGWSIEFGGQMTHSLERKAFV